MSATLLGDVTEAAAEGLVRGLAGGLADNADKIIPVFENLAVAVVRAARAAWNESHTAVVATAPPETKALNDALADSIAAGLVPAGG